MLETCIDIPVMNKKPDNIDIEKIHEEVYKEVQDAFFEKEPFKIIPEVEGVDFDIEEAKKILSENKEQYEQFETDDKDDQKLKREEDV